MRQKELRIALICYGGVSLAVYMHGVTKELWKLLRASRSGWAGLPPPGGVEAVYMRLLQRLEAQHGVKLRVLADIVAGASAGGINSVFLAQAIHSGQSLEPLTDLWLEIADVDVLLDPEARPGGRGTKFWAAPIVQWMLHRPGNAISASVAPETRTEVREKLSRLIRSRWFEPPFSGPGFSGLLAQALRAMSTSVPEGPLLPAGHPLDLFVTATDFKGHLEALRLHSPAVVMESEHRLTIGFSANVPAKKGAQLAPLPELVLAARATASFPGAFPPLQIAEIDAMVDKHGIAWPGRELFLKRIMPKHVERGDLDGVALIDGSVLVNAPFADAMSVLRNRPAHREVDRRFVYIDPTPDRRGRLERSDKALPGFFSVIFGSLSSIPREQPIRDNLEALERDSREMATLRSIIEALQPEVEEAVDKLFGRMFFLDRPTAKRLAAWRAKAQAAAWTQAGFAYHGYSQVKFTGLIAALARTIHACAPGLGLASSEPIAATLGAWFASEGLDRLSALRGGASTEAVDLFRTHDLAFRIRRLRLLARRVTEGGEDEETITEADRDAAREVIYEALALYLEREPPKALGPEFCPIAENVFADPGAAVDFIAKNRALARVDAVVDEMLADVMARMPDALRRRMLLTYLGFPFYDTVTLPLLRGEGMNEFEPAKVDRISPDDCNAIREGGATATLRGTEFYNFGAFFSRAYRENDYLWGRLHGAERMVDLIVSTLDAGNAMTTDEIKTFQREAFLAILDEEEARLTADSGLISGLRREVLAMEK